MQSMAMILRTLLSVPNQRSPPAVGHQLQREVGSNQASINGSDLNDDVKVISHPHCIRLHMPSAATTG